MRADTKQALALLRDENLTCAVCGGEDAYKSTARGVAPLLNWLDNGMRFSGFCAADKVVGAGAAYLYVLLGVVEVYAEILSESAQKVLQRYEISVHFGTLVPRIRNRAGDGFCPIEDAVSNATDAQDALERIRARLKELRG
jgi:hypothetical protein